MAPAARLHDVQLHCGGNSGLNVRTDGEECPLSFHENINGQWRALAAVVVRQIAPKRTLMGLQRKTLKRCYILSNMACQLNQAL